jgi:hypothetical protein
LDSGFLLWFLFVQAFILTFAFVVAPLLPFRKFKVKWKVIFYFLFIGLGFILVEVVLIQKLTFFFGNVVVSAALVLFAMLAFSGTGSLLSERIIQNSKKKFMAALALICLILIFYSAMLQRLIMQMLGTPLAAKLFAAVVIIAPVAFLMGMPFPTAIRAIDVRSVPWAFAVNGAASVLGSILAVIIASELGYFTVLIAAAVCYFFSLAVVLAPSRLRAQTSQLL